MSEEPETADFIIIGGGIAGASAGYELSKTGRVIILEKESHPAYHTTGRSSAIFQKGYSHGDPVIHALVMASEDFLRHPPKGFADHPLLTPRVLIYIASKNHPETLENLYHNLSAIDVGIELIDADQTARIFPCLTPEYQNSAILEKDVADMDVTALHEGYLRAIRTAGGQIMTDAGVHGLTRKGGYWHVRTTTQQFRAPVVINAAGAWVDQVAEMANITPIDIRPLRRTVMLVPPPAEIGPDIDNLPFVMDAGQGFYFKPDAGKILVTPGDQHLSVPCDARPEEIDIALGVHYLEKATGLKIGKVDHSWAGLRNHVADGHPVVGFDPESDGFFWLAAQGGFGIKTAPAMGRIAASLIAGGGLPLDIYDLGLTEDQISISRLKKQPPRP